MNQTVSVAIISDTHAYLHPEIKKVVSRADIAIHAGDICDGDILDLMKPRSGQVIAVAGNNDDERLWPAHQAKRVKKLPKVARLELPGGIVKIEHGHVHDMTKPDHDDLRRAHPEAKMVVYGHTHKKVIDDYTTPWVVNPGAAGATRTRGGASCLLLTASKSIWKIESLRFNDDAVKVDQVSAA